VFKVFLVMKFHKFKKTLMGDEKHENKQGKNILKIEITIRQCRRSSGTQKSKKLIKAFRVC
jgi:hypothetical protein